MMSHRAFGLALLFAIVAGLGLTVALVNAHATWLRARAASPNGHAYSQILGERDATIAQLQQERDAAQERVKALEATVVALEAQAAWFREAAGLR